jgi:hypothetical protein
MEKRKIIYQDGSYQLLKPKEDEKFFPYGERKSLKAIADLFRAKRFELIMSPEIEKTINEYIRKQENKRKKYKSALESKTI